MDATDRFLNQQNIDNYRKRLDAGTDQNQRKVILQLLVEEEEKLRQPASKQASSAKLP